MKINFKAIGRTGFNAGTSLLKIGVAGVMQQYWTNEFRKETNAFIRDVEDGVDHAKVKLKLIKRED